MNDTICLILGGGAGSRLFPLTKDRSKPAVPIGGKFRLIDIPISNSLNSDVNKILILTQFNSASLNNHINKTYRFDHFHDGFVDILAAEQSIESTGWYQGTADAVRKNIKHITSFPHVKHVLILSGDQIYTMDFRGMMERHRETDADVTLAVLPCNDEDATGFGIMKMQDGNIKEFIEKPKKEALKDWKSTSFITQKFPGIEKGKDYLASMGIYIFKLETLIELLSQDYKDFGKEVIPYAIGEKKVSGYLFNGYWEDVGTIKSFWRANLDFVSDHPKFDFYQNQIYTHARFLPPSKLNGCEVVESLVCEGSVLRDVRLKQTVIGIRSILREGTVVEKSIVMGADYFEDPGEPGWAGTIPLGIGKNCLIQNAIIDKNARIGDNCRIVNAGGITHADGENFYIRDSIVIIPKNAVVPNGAVI